jgi:hypothetical protein
VGLDATVYDDDSCETKLGSMRIGNIATVGDLRREIEKIPGEFPILLKRVIYNGSHCGDEVPANLVADLKAELDQLPAGPDWLNEFKIGLTTLCEIALKSGKPIMF